MEKVKEKKKKILKGIIIGKEIIGEKIYAHVSCVDGFIGKVLIEENELHDFDVRDKVGLLLGAEIEFKIDNNYDEELGAYIGSRKQANEILQKRLEKLSVGYETNASIIIVAKNNIIVNIYGNDVKIKAKDLKLGWIEDLRERLKIGQDIKVKIVSIEPLKLEVINKKKTFHADKYKIGNEYVAKIVGAPEFGIIAEIENNRQVLCYHVDWKDEPKVGEYIVIQISDVKPEEEKTYGYVKRRIRR
ncbi:hypothetical protein JYG23_12315 [Sedimentibacter sp. zth1]|uniref:hypothetical protein n=1 Tax=Sedimentibacter sp. zth1 TaxID=2816908 RepID=UPI001A91E5E8|nr:hypothetical protein [Sedimentibacter sp. zth1]QSX05452.1 hypothetical protein JYG23_12315 [Sedimentibacter sp. zth1]